MLSSLNDSARQKRHHRRTVGIAVVIAGDLADQFLGLKRSGRGLFQDRQDLIARACYGRPGFTQFNHRSLLTVGAIIAPEQTFRTGLTAGMATSRECRSVPLYLGGDGLPLACFVPEEEVLVVFTWAEHAV